MIKSLQRSAEKAVERGRGFFDRNEDNGWKILGYICLNHIVPWNHTDRLVANHLINGTTPRGERLNSKERFVRPLPYLGVRIFATACLGGLAYVAHETLEKSGAYEFLEKIVS